MGDYEGARLRNVPIEAHEEEYLIQQRQDREDRRARAQAAEDRPSLARRKLGIAYTVMVVLAVIFTFIMGIYISKASVPTPKTPAVNRTNGDFGSAPTTVFVDDGAITLGDNAFTAMTDYCIPDPSSAVMQEIQALNGGGTNAQLTRLFRQMREAVNDTCDFYGLAAAEFRADLLPTPGNPYRGIGPADICHGNVKTGLAAFLVRFDGQFPANFGTLMTAVVAKAYPLNVFWAGMGVSSADVIGVLTAMLDTAITDRATGGFNTKTFATKFCNQWFAAGEPGYYRARVQPWLGFPFPGTMQRQGHNAVSPMASQTLANFSLSSEYAVKEVFVFGDVLATPAVTLFIQAALGSLPITLVPGDDITQSFEIMYNAITDDAIVDFLPDATPVLVLGRFAQDPSAFSSFEQFGTNILYAVTDVPDAGESIATTAMINRNISRLARSPDVISVLDFTTHLAYETDLGPEYIDELDVAQVIATIIRDQNSIVQTRTTILEDTFALKNVNITRPDGTGPGDVGMRATINAAAALGRLNGRGTGFKPPAYAVQMMTAVEREVDPAFGVGGTASIPAVFSWRTERPECMGPVIDQGVCNCCWSAATSLALGIRMCTTGLTSVFAPVSIQHVTSCATINKNGCVDDSPFTAMSFTSLVGAVDSACFPFTNGDKKNEVSCKSICDVSKSTTAYTEFTTDERSHAELIGSTKIKTELITNGPMSVGFAIPLNFCEIVDRSDRKDAVWTQASTVKGRGECGSGNHLVTLVGYNDNASPKYWEIQNSWGSDWGDNGFFRVEQDVFERLTGNGVWFENNAYVAAPRSVTQSDPDAHIPVTGPDDPPDVINDPRGDDSGASSLPVTRILLLLCVVFTIWVVSMF